jgi:hypothetical protein
MAIATYEQVSMIWPRALAAIIGVTALLLTIGMGLISGLVSARYSNVPEMPAVLWATLSLLPYTIPAIFIAGVLWWMSNDPRGGK